RPGRSSFTNPPRSRPPVRPIVVTRTPRDAAADQPSGGPGGSPASRPATESKLAPQRPTTRRGAGRRTGMEFRKILTLRGSNYWASFPVLEAWVDLGELKDSPSNELPGFNERLMAWLPSMIEHRCTIGEQGGFFERLRQGTYQAHILEHVTLELQ